MDTRVAKNIKLGENRNLQLIFQAFNLFNHSNYGNSFDNLSATLNSVTHATVTSNAGFTNPNNFINPAGNGTLPRAFIAEFGARFSF